MTNLLPSLAVRRFAAIGLLFALLGLLWLVTVEPLLAVWEERGAALETTEKQLQAMHRRAQWGGHEKEILEAARQAVDNSPLLIRATSTSQAAAQFQADLRRRVDGVGAQTRSIQALPAVQSSGLERLVVRLEGSVGADRLLDWLYAIEGQSAPLAVIEALELRGQEFSSSTPTGNTILQFRLDVAGYRRIDP